MSKTMRIARAQEQMRQHLSMPPWSVEEKLVLASRILHAQGHDSGLAGQITARVDGSADFLTQQMGLGLDEIKISNLLRVDPELQVIAGRGMPNPANRFHAWIYRERPDVRCIIHTHALHASALSMLGRPLQVAHMDSCALYDDVGYLPAWPGVPVSDNEGELICAALGDRRAVLLAHHGLLVACHTVEEACVLAIQFEYAAKLQLLASAAGEIQAVDPTLAREAHDWLLHENRVQATFYYHARRILQQFPGCLVRQLVPEMPNAWSSSVAAS
jgi:L-fuculose-phosphate aldolase